MKLIRRFSSKSAHFSFFRLNAITTEDRHKSLSDIQSAVSMSNGFIHNFSLFSNYSASLSIELSSLHEVSNLAERIRSYGWNVNVTPKEIETENIKSTKPILGTVQISFVKENGDLKITVPSIPG